MKSFFKASSVKYYEYISTNVDYRMTTRGKCDKTTKGFEETYMLGVAEGIFDEKTH